MYVGSILIAVSFLSFIESRVIKLIIGLICIALYIFLKITGKEKNYKK